jgi:5'-phosphate synthase pdxT subunit
MKVSIGVASLQGDVEEHLRATSEALARLGLEGQVVRLRLPEEVEAVDAVILPGGESTVIGRLSSYSKALDALRRRIREGLPVMGTCAGLIILARRVYDRVVGETGQPILGVLDVTVERNAFGRQRESFEVLIDLPALNIRNYKAVFIRAPAIIEVGPGVEVLASLGERPVAVRQESIFGTAFHPELSGNTVLHEELLKAAVAYKRR